ncbi:MAG TPA: DUF3631 domain-containing protein [Candidatus Angelobacter sp.]
MKSTREYLSKLLPRFNKTNHQLTNSVDKKIRAGKALAMPADLIQRQPQLPPPPDPVAMLDSLAKFLRRHLVCEDYQLTLLALWIVHTWCFRSFPTAAYLHVRSVEAQSGKTLCLKLLAALCDSPLLASGVHWRSIMDNLLTPDRRVVPNKPSAASLPRTILLDDCQNSFAASERQRIVGLLNAGSQADCIYLDGLKHYCVFGPKAFAGNARLPRSLDSRCIPLVLRRKKPSDLMARFNSEAAASVASLARSLESWALANSAALAKVAHQPPARLPAGLSARQQDCAEPLLHLADRVAGPWPEKARAALVSAFKLSEDSLALELLADIRAFFFLKEDPTYLSTHDLLAGLTRLEHRPWSNWKNGVGGGRRLSTFLHPLGIRSRDFRKGSAPTFKGYLREPFVDAWERYLAPTPADWPQVRAAMKKEAETQSATSN